LGRPYVPFFLKNISKSTWARTNVSKLFQICTPSFPKGTGPAILLSWEKADPEVIRLLTSEFSCEDRAANVMPSFLYGSTAVPGALSPARVRRL
jgi:hypothetical protein